MNDSAPIQQHSTAIPVPGGAVPIVTRGGGDRPGPALVIAPAVFGITADLLGQMEALAPHASLVAAMDLYWRDATPGPLGYDDMVTVIARIRALDRTRAFADFAAVAAWARQQPGCDGRVVGLGICFGGPFCLLGAAAGLLQGVVTWHGTRIEEQLSDVAEMRCPMALHFGERDRVVPLAAVEQVRAAFAGRRDVRVVVHPGADHGFSHPAAPTYDAEAAAAGMESVRRLLASAR